MWSSTCPASTAEPADAPGPTPNRYQPTVWMSCGIAIPPRSSTPVSTTGASSRASTARIRTGGGAGGAAAIVAVAVGAAIAPTVGDGADGAADVAGTGSRRAAGATWGDGPRGPTSSPVPPNSQS